MGLTNTMKYAMLAALIVALCGANFVHADEKNPPSNFSVILCQKIGHDDASRNRSMQALMEKINLQYNLSIVRDYISRTRARSESEELITKKEKAELEMNLVKLLQMKEDTLKSMRDFQNAHAANADALGLYFGVDWAKDENSITWNDDEGCLEAKSAKDVLGNIKIKNVHIVQEGHSVSKTYSAAVEQYRLEHPTNTHYGHVDEDVFHQKPIPPELGGAEEWAIDKMRVHNLFSLCGLSLFHIHS